MKKRFRRITCILIILTFVLPLLIKPVFTSANEEQTEGTITMTPSYNTSNGRLSVKGKVVDGSNIKVTIKIISPFDKLVYIGEEMSDGEGNFVFTGPITYEEGMYRIYIGSEITEQAAMFPFKIIKKTPVEPDPEPEPDSSPGTGAGTGMGGTGQSLKEQVNSKIEEMLKNIDTKSLDIDKALQVLEDIITQAGSLKDDEKNSIKEEIGLLARKIITEVTRFDINKLAEKSENAVITEDKNMKKVEITNKAIAEAIELIERAYERLVNALEENGFNEISADIYKNKAIRFVCEADKNLGFGLTVKSIDDISSKGIEVVIDNGSVEGMSFTIPSGVMDLEYMLKYLKEAGEEIKNSEELKERKVYIMIKKVEEGSEGSQEHKQAANEKQKGNATFSSVSRTFDLYVLVEGNNENGIYIEKFNRKLAIEIPLSEEIVKAINEASNNGSNSGSLATKNKIDKEKLGVYRYNPDLKQWDYVGGRVNPDTGRISFRTDSLSTYSVYEYNKTFKDIEKNWARGFIEVLASKHVVHGVNDESFQPDRNVTRAEFAKMLLEALELVDSSAKTTFTDVAEDSWYYKYVATAQTLGIATGTTGNRFKPEDVINRQDMAVMAYRTVKAAGIDLPEIKEYKIFTDDNQISRYAKEAVKVLQQAGILEGKGKNIFMPKNNSARAEAAKIIYMLIQKL